MIVERVSGNNKVEMSVHGVWLHTGSTLSVYEEYFHFAHLNFE